MMDATMPTIIAMPVVSELTLRLAPLPGTAATSWVVAGARRTGRGWFWVMTGPTSWVVGPGKTDEGREESGRPVRSRDSAGRADATSAQSDDGRSG